MLPRALKITTALTSALAIVCMPWISAAAGAAAGPSTAHAATGPVSPLAYTRPAGPASSVTLRDQAHPSLLAVPAAAPSVPAAAAVHQAASPVVRPAAAVTGWGPTVAGQEATLSIPSLGLRLPILLGGQATIDRGLVTHYEASGWRPPVPAGAPGTYWLAAHHSTHGSPFGSLPNIRAGALVVIDVVGGPEIRYQVTSMQVVGTSASYTTVYGSDSTTPRILLQTCEGGAYRLLVHGVRIS